MASVAESVARLTHPSNQTGFGRPKNNRILCVSLSLRIRRQRPVLHDGYPDRILVIILLAIDGETAVVADLCESVRRIRNRLAVGVPLGAVEANPDAVGRTRTRNRFDRRTRRAARFRRRQGGCHRRGGCRNSDRYGGSLRRLHRRGSRGDRKRWGAAPCCSRELAIAPSLVRAHGRAPYG